MNEFVSVMLAIPIIVITWGVMLWIGFEAAVIVYRRWFR